MSILHLTVDQILEGSQYSFPFSQSLFQKKRAHAVVYTARVFSECSRPHLMGVQAPSLSCLLLSYNQFNTRFFSFVFYFGLQFIITPIAKYKFLFFGNPYFVLLIFKNKSRRLLLNTKINIALIYEFSINSIRKNKNRTFYESGFEILFHQCKCLHSFLYIFFHSFLCCNYNRRIKNRFIRI